MSLLFADSFYFFALLNPNDAAHGKASAFTASYTGKVLTTCWVLTELADGCARPSHRRKLCSEFLSDLRANPNVRVEPCSESLLHDGIALYSQRPDKEWSLTDCISFSVMEREGITEALTGDHHFEQAGFVALLK
jgi:predicted nucleic acid-binding protein